MSSRSVCVALLTLMQMQDYPRGGRYRPMQAQHCSAGSTWVRYRTIPQQGSERSQNQIPTGEVLRSFCTSPPQRKAWFLRWSFLKPYHPIAIPRLLGTRAIRSCNVPVEHGEENTCRMQGDMHSMLTSTHICMQDVQEYWQKIIEGVDKPTARKLADKLDLTHPLGLQLQPRGRRPPLFQYTLDRKLEHPTHVLLIRVWPRLLLERANKDSV